ncbi:protein SPIRAL1-like 1 [Apium graveolens]|uniref:protein SPIRAL1-like 1 n=1 Tax=Apium graveolens TaxID=4045 RepID=UPI003D7B83EA
MNRGGSCGGGQSSLGYLFGSGEAPKASGEKIRAIPDEVQIVTPSAKPEPTPEPVDITKQIPAGINSAALNSTAANNYFRADGQNTGNFLTERPSTKVHAAPGGESSLGYLFGGVEK